MRFIFYENTPTCIVCLSCCIRHGLHTNKITCLIHSIEVHPSSEFWSSVPWWCCVFGAGAPVFDSVRLHRAFCNLLKAYFIRDVVDVCRIFRVLIEAQAHLFMTALLVRQTKTLIRIATSTSRTRLCTFKAPQSQTRWVNAKVQRSLGCSSMLCVSHWALLNHPPWNLVSFQTLVPHFHSFHVCQDGESG